MPESEHAADAGVDKTLVIAGSVGPYDYAVLHADDKQEMLDWLKKVVTGTAVENYSAWGDVLTASFGPRKFVRLDLPAAKLYRKG